MTRKCSALAARAIANGYDPRYRHFFDGLSDGLQRKTKDILRELELDREDRIRMQEGSQWKYYPKNAPKEDILALVEWLSDWVMSGQNAYNYAVQSKSGYYDGLGFTLIVRQNGYGEPFVRWVTSKTGAKLFGGKNEFW